MPQCRNMHMNFIFTEVKGMTFQYPGQMETLHHHVSLTLICFTNHLLSHLLRFQLRSLIKVMTLIY